MSRIQQILDKAEREGRMRRTTATPAPPAAPREVPSAREVQPQVYDAARGYEAPPAHEPPRIGGGLRPAPGPVPPQAPAAPRPAPPTLTNPVIRPARQAQARLSRLIVAAAHPHSPTSEQYRALRTRIAQADGNRYYRTILVTSPAPGDGKTVTSINLAFAMAQEFHRRVLLIDADLRNPGLHRLLGIERQPGLSDVLLGDASPEEALVMLPEQRVTVLPAGTHVDQASELLGSAEMRRLLDSLRTQFDRILLDTPPASPLADVGVMAPLTDGVLLVVRAGHTQRPAIDRALEDIDPARVLGLVLNDVEEPGLQYRYGPEAVAAPSPWDGPERPRRGSRASA